MQPPQLRLMPAPLPHTLSPPRLQRPPRRLRPRPPHRHRNHGRVPGVPSPQPPDGAVAIRR